MVTTYGAKEPSGRLGAVLRLQGRSDPVALSKHGPWVVTTVAHAKQVLADTATFDFPTDVSRRSDAAPDAEGGTNRSRHAITPPVGPEAVDRGVAVFASELSTAVRDRGVSRPVDVMQLLRRPVARSTTSAVLPLLAVPDRDRVADLVLAWVDALGPVIASGRPPRRWSRIRRRETRARLDLQSALSPLTTTPVDTAVVLAAGTQVPIAAGAWLLCCLAQDRPLADRLRQRGDLALATAWETVRLYPPTWITARITSGAVTVGATPIPAGAVVMVSPLLLGRSDALAPGPDHGQASLEVFDPFRWDQHWLRPGAWLPFGAGPHACPGRNLGIGQLRHLATAASAWRLSAAEPVSVDQSRGIFPSPARLVFEEC